MTGKIDKTTTRFIIVAVALVIVILLMIFIPKGGTGTGNAVSSSKGPIKIGIIAPLTSNAADIGKSNKFAMELAVEEINAAGGVNGRPFKLIVEDSKGCDPKEGVTAMQKLVNIDGVDAVYSVCSGVALSTHPIAELGKTVHFGCASSSDITPLGDYMFRIVPSDDFAGKVAAKYVQEEFDAQKVAVLYCDNDWCVGIKESFKETFKSLGGEIVAEEQIRTGAKDAKTELTKLINKNPDLIYFPGYPAESITVFRQAKELGINVPFFGGDAWMDQSIPDEAGETAVNKYFTTPALNYDAEFGRKVHEDIAICTPESYDVVYILAKIIEKVGTDSEAMKEELYKLKGYRGQSGIITLDEKGDLVGATFDIMTFGDGEIVKHEAKVRAE